MKLENKIALVIGSSSGIGKEIALRFFQEGALVILTYNRNEKGAREVEKEIIKRGGRVVVYCLNVESNESIKKCIGEVMEKFGRIDILVNNAGVYIRENFIDTSEESWNKTLNTNLRGVFFCSQLIAKKMAEKGGVIINISSNASRKWRDRGIVYSLSKSGIDYLTKSLALILAPKFRVNAISPGHTLTPMSLTSSNEKIRVKIEKNIPLHRINQPKDIANLAVFLASGDSKNITGEVIKVDGGDSLINLR